MTKSKEAQIEKFKQAARELETDDNEKRFDERLGKIAEQKPAPKPKEKERRCFAIPLKKLRRDFQSPRCGRWRPCLRPHIIGLLASHVFKR
jgi:hypothetical protein